jgi:hypothetical protein
VDTEGPPEPEYSSGAHHPKAIVRRPLASPHTPLTSTTSPVGSRPPHVVLTTQFFAAKASPGYVWAEEDSCCQQSLPHGRDCLWTDVTGSDTLCRTKVYRRGVHARRRTTHRTGALRRKPACQVGLQLQGGSALLPECLRLDRPEVIRHQGGLRWQAVCLLAQAGGTFLTAYTHPPCQGLGSARGCHPFGHMCASAAWAVREGCLSPISAVRLLLRAS